MDTKKCVRCKKKHDLDSFANDSRTKDGKQCYCRSCQKAIRRSRYIKNRHKEIDRATENQKKFREWFKSIKPDTCSKCGFKHPAVIDFHHVNNDKEASVTALVRFSGKKRVLEEIAKCIPLCANCHRIHHYDENNANA